MINLANNRIEIGTRSGPIQRFEIWWAVPGVGLFSDIKPALAHASGKPLITTPVAVGEGDLYEVVPPEVEIDLAG